MLQLFENEYYWILSSDKNNKICYLCDKIDLGLSNTFSNSLGERNPTADTTIIKKMIPVIFFYDPDNTILLNRILDFIRNG